MKKISHIELSSLLLCIIITFNSGLTLNIIKNNLGIDSWIAILLSYIIGIIPIIIIIYISNYQDELNIFQKNINLFGKILGNIINITIDIILFIIASIILKNTINFTTITYLYHTPPLLLTIIFMLVIIYCTNKGINVICHISLILLSFSIIIYLLTSISLINELKLDNLLPLLTTNKNNILISSLKLVCINTLPIITILIVPKDKIANKKKYNKSLIISYIIGSIISILTITNTISLLGIHLTKIYNYPEYIALKKIKLLGFLERSENIISLKWITEAYIYITIIIYTISKSITNNKIKQNYINIITGILLIITTNYITPKNIYITYIFIPIYIIIIIKILINKLLHIKSNTWYN